MVFDFGGEKTLHVSRFHQYDVEKNFFPSGNSKTWLQLHFHGMFLWINEFARLFLGYLIL
jgi:hypothetical protein